MFFSKLWNTDSSDISGNNNSTNNNNNNNNNNNINTNNNPDNNNNNNSNNSRFSSFGFNNISVSSETFKKLGSSVQTFAKNAYSKIEEETKKLVDEGPNTFNDSTFLPPWLDFVIEDKELQNEIREKILDLKMSRATFLNSPPIDADYFQEFDDYLIKVATVSLKHDLTLEKIRFHFVPKLVSEEQFWKNWYYRVLVVKKRYGILNSVNNNKTSSDKKDNNNNISDNDNSGNNKTSDSKTTPASLTTTNTAATTTSSSTSNPTSLSINKQKVFTPTEDSEIGNWEKELQSELDNFEINDGNIELSLNNDLLDDEDWESKIGLELSSPSLFKQSQPPSQQAAITPNKNNSSSIKSFSPSFSSTSFSTPPITTTDSDIDLEIERELQRIKAQEKVSTNDSNSNNITTEQLLNEIESEISLAKDSLKDSNQNIGIDNNIHEDNEIEEDIVNTSSVENNINSSINISYSDIDSVVSDGNIHKEEDEENNQEKVGGLIDDEDLLN